MAAWVDVSRDILSRGDGSSRGSTLYPRLLGGMGVGKGVGMVTVREGGGCGRSKGIGKQGCSGLMREMEIG